MTRKVLWLGLIALLLTLLGGGYLWLFRTDAGLAWAYAQLQARLPGTLEVQTLAGHLGGPLDARGVHYKDASVDTHIQHVSVDWSPLALLLGRLQVHALSIDGARINLAAPTETKKEPLRLSTPPIRVHLTQVTLRDIEVQRAGAAPYTLQSLELGASIRGDTLRIEQLQVQAQGLQLQARGAFGLTGGSERLNIDWRIAPANLPPVAGEGEIIGNVANFSVVQRLSEPVAAEVRAQVRDALSKPSWRAEVEAAPIDVSKIRSGAAAAWSVGLKLTAEGDDARFQSAGTFDARHPSVATVVGKYRLRGSTAGDVTVEELMLTVPNTDAELTAQGRWQASDRTFNAQVRWHDFSWPLTGAPTITTPAGQLDIEGTPANYRATLGFAITGSTLPAATWSVAGAGDTTRFTLDKLLVDTLGTTLKGAGRIAWSPKLSWEARLQGQSIDPGVAWPKWPGKLALDARIAGSTDQVSLELNALNGRLRGFPVSAQARVTRRGEHYPTLALALKSGDFNANVSGAITKQWDISWRIAAPDLGAVLPKAAGRVHSTGQIGGARATPLLQTQIVASALAYEDVEIGRLNADVRLDVSDRTKSSVNLQAANVLFKEREITLLALRGDGLIAEHALTTDVRSAGVGLRAQWAGRYAAAAWRGIIESSVLRVGAEDWMLTGRPALLLSKQKIALDETCWRAAAAHTCAQFSRDASTGTALGLVAERVPLALFAPLLPSSLELRGSFSGNARARLDDAGLRNASARFEAVGGSIAFATATRAAMLVYENAHAQLQVDENGLRAHADIGLPGGDGGAFDVRLPRFNADNAGGGNQPIDGRLTVNLRDLSAVAPLLPEIEELRGRLSADVAFSGALAEPNMRGNVTLADASGRVPVLGIRVDQVRLAALADGQRQIRLSGQARSDEGELGLAGQLTLGSGLAWRAAIRIAGNRFQVADLPDARVLVSPDLRLDLAPRQVNLRGEIVIPQAQITLRPRRSTINISSDVVVVNDPEVDSTRHTPWAVKAEVKMVLGDDVHLEGLGLSAKVAGSLIAVDSPTQVTTARGEVHVVEGKYEAFGQKLDIERGRLLFVGGPIDDPGIDARAVRHIEEITTGVEVKGTLKSPQLAIFSEPPMGQADALSYLLFGKPVDSANPAQGAKLAAVSRALKLAGGEQLAQRLGRRFGIEEIEIESGTRSEDASLVLGKRLSPKLYVNYSIGLFEQVNLFRIRYQLSARWALQAESGTYSGADLLFSIER